MAQESALETVKKARQKSMKIENKDCIKISVTISFLLALTLPAIAAAQGCYDSDNGKNVFERGTVTFSDYETSKSQMDYCINEKSLNEFSCSQGFVVAQSNQCLNGCEKGACKSSDSNQNKLTGNVFADITGNAAGDLTAADFSGDFEMGNGMNFVQNGTNTYQIDAEPSPFGTLTGNIYFKVTNVLGKNPIFNVRFNHGVNTLYQAAFFFQKAHYSYDQRNWNIITNTPLSATNVWTINSPTFTQNTVWIAIQVPYHYSTDYNEDRSRWVASPFVTKKVLGKSVENLDIELFTVTNPSSPIPESTKKVYYVVSLAHPSEYFAAWRVRGMIEWALSSDPEAIRFRDVAILKATLTSNVDGWVNGHLRTNSLGRDMNRNYSTTGANSVLEMPEQFAIHKDIDDYMASNHINVLLDSHTDLGQGADYLMRPAAMPNDAAIASLTSLMRSVDTANYLSDVAPPVDTFPLSTLSNALYAQYKSRGLKAFIIEGGGLKHANGVYITKTSQTISGGVMLKAFHLWLSPASALPIVSLTASPVSVTSGGESTITWSSTSASSCTASGSWSGSKTTSGTQIVNPTSTSSYILACTGSGGTTTRNTTVTVFTPIPTISFVASPTSIVSGNSATLTWTSTDATSCTASGAWTGSKTIIGNQTVNPAVTSTYTLVCTGPGGSDTKSATVTVSPLPDTTLPTVSITYPLTGATVSSTITVSATASDNVAVTGVQFKLNGTNLGTEDTTSPYSISWDTKITSNGLHTLTAVARDAAGNTGTNSISANVINSYNISTDADNDTIPDSIDKCILTLSNRTDKYGCPLPKVTEFTDIVTTNFSNVDLTNLTALKLGKTDAAMIDFGDNFINLVINGTKPVDLDGIIDLLPGKIIVRVELFKNLNVSSTLSFFNITNITNPKILKNAATCEDCKIESYVNNIIKLKVPHFTEYSIEEGSYCGDTYCSTQESCSSCSNDCGACPTSGGSSGGGGSGGGGSSGGGSSGGGGGGSAGFVCNMDWQCGSWNECDGKWQTRECAFGKVGQHTQSAPCQTLSDQPSLARRCELPKVEPKEDSRNVAETTDVVIPEPELPPKEELKSQKKRLSFSVLIFVFAFLGMILAGSGFYEFEHHKKIKSNKSRVKSDDPLYDYAGEMFGKGFTKEDVKEELLKSGWELEKIESTLKKF